MRGHCRRSRLVVCAAAAGLAACGGDAEPAAPQAHARLCDPPGPMAAVAAPAGDFEMGALPIHPEEGPTQSVSVAAFRIDPHEVTNRDFTAFVADTGYVTMAERTPDPEAHPDIPPESLVAGSAVFMPPLESANVYWWTFVPGASWRRPEGPGSDVDDRLDHPVVHIAYEDALAYAAWRGGDLPTEAEWEYAARAGGPATMYEWGETPPDRQPARANTWQGAFPIQNSARDGFVGSAPVACYPPNDFGLYDMTGNAWEWVKDGGDDAVGLLKGGSFLCAPNYCARYRPSARHPQERDFSAAHIGFRVVYRDVPDGAAP